MSYGYRNAGIGVDVHVHRITNRFGWHKPPTKTPEETRCVALPPYSKSTAADRLEQAEFAILASSGTPPRNQPPARRLRPGARLSHFASLLCRAVAPWQQVIPSGMLTDPAHSHHSHTASRPYARPWDPSATNASSATGSARAPRGVQARRRRAARSGRWARRCSRVLPIPTKLPARR